MKNIKLFIIAALAVLSINSNAQESQQPSINKIQLTLQAGAAFNASTMKYSNGYRFNVNLFSTYRFSDNLKAGFGFQNAADYYYSFSAIYFTGIIQPSMKKIVPYARISIGRSSSENKNLSSGLMTGFSAGINAGASPNLSFNLEAGFKTFSYTDNWTPSVRTAWIEAKTISATVTHSLFDLSFGMSLGF